MPKFYFRQKDIEQIWKKDISGSGNRRVFVLEGMCCVLLYVCTNCAIIIIMNNLYILFFREKKIQTKQKPRKREPLVENGMMTFVISSLTILFIDLKQWQNKKQKNIQKKLVLTTIFTKLLLWLLLPPFWKYRFFPR